MSKDFNDFESFIKVYPDVLRLANRIKKNPGELINFLLYVGGEVKEKTTNHFIDELDKKLRTFVSSNNIEVSQNALNRFDDLLEFMKQHNKKNEVTK